MVAEMFRRPSVPTALGKLDGGEAAEAEENWHEAYKSIEHYARRPSEEDFQHLIELCSENGINSLKAWPDVIPPMIIQFFAFFDACEENAFEPYVMRLAEKCVREYPSRINPPDVQLFVTYYCRRCIKSIRNAIRPTFNFCRILITRIPISDTVLPLIVTTMAFLSTQEVYFSCAFTVVKLLFEHHYGGEVIKILQKLMATDLSEELLDNISTYTCTAMARGAIDLYTFTFWGPDRVLDLEMPLTPMVPYYLKAIESDRQVCKEVLKSLSLIVVKHGSELDALTWESIIQLLYKVSESEDIQGEEIIIKKFDYVTTHMNKLVTHGNFHGSVEHFFDLVHATATLQADEVLMSLIEHIYEKIASSTADRFPPMRQFLDKYLRPENNFSTAVREKAAKIVDFLGVYSILTTMPKSIELKATIKNFEATYAQAQRYCHGEPPQVMKQFVTYFVSHHGRLSLREFLETENSHGELIFYELHETKDNDTKISEFVKTDILDVKNLKETLQLSMSLKGSLKKTRYLFTCDQYRIYLDRVEDLGDFIEVEVCLNGNRDPTEGYQTAVWLLKEFGISTNDFIEGAYIDKLIENMD